MKIAALTPESVKFLIGRDYGDRWRETQELLKTIQDIEGATLGYTGKIKHFAVTVPKHKLPSLL